MPLIDRFWPKIVKNSAKNPIFQFFQVALAYIYIWFARPEGGPDFGCYIFLSINFRAGRLPANEPGATLVRACPRNLCFCLQMSLLAVDVNTAGGRKIRGSLGGVSTSIFI